MFIQIRVNGTLIAFNYSKSPHINSRGGGGSSSRPSDAGPPARSSSRDDYRSGDRYDSRDSRDSRDGRDSRDSRDSRGGGDRRPYDAPPAYGRPSGPGPVPAPAPSPGRPGAIGRVLHFTITDARYPITVRARLQRVVVCCTAVC